MTARISPRFAADLALLLVAFIWGLTFVMVRDAVQTYPVFAFLGARFFLAFAAMLPLTWLLRGRMAGWGGAMRPGIQMLTGVMIGLFLFAGYAFQTVGLQYTTPAKAGFITGLAVVLAPLLDVLLLRARPRPAVWAGVALATAGLALLALAGVNLQAGVNLGDVLVFFCALSFAAHIFLNGLAARRMNPLALALMQILTVAILSTLVSHFFEPAAPLWPQGQPLFAVIFTGVLATTLAYGVQTTAQRFTTVTHTALIFTAEPVFAALASFILIGERLSPGQMLGAALILAGMIASEFRPGVR